MVEQFSLVVRIKLLSCSKRNVICHKNVSILISMLCLFFIFPSSPPSPSSTCSATCIAHLIHQKNKTITRRPQLEAPQWKSRAPSRMPSCRPTLYWRPMATLRQPVTTTRPDSWVNSQQFKTRDSNLNSHFINSVITISPPPPPIFHQT